MNRKTFLMHTGALGLGAAVAGVAPVWESLRFNRRLFRVRSTRNLMGTFVTITVMHRSRGRAEDAIGAAFAEMERVSRPLTRHRSDSAVGTLNGSGALSDPPRELCEVLERAGHHHRISGGAFDITVEPLVRSYKEHFEATGSAPSEGDVTRICAKVGAAALHFDGRSIRFGKDGMGITLDGIAKGYVVDRGAEVIGARGIEHGLINAGGDVRAIGGADAGSPWRIAVRDPGNANAYCDRIKIRSGAVATSGNYEVYFDREKLHHHIINPATGCSPRRTKSVTVTARCVMDADALSTSVFVLGPGAGIQLIERLPDSECLILHGESGRVTSPGWKSA